MAKKRNNVTYSQDNLNDEFNQAGHRPSNPIQMPRLTHSPQTTTTTTTTTTTSANNTTSTTTTTTTTTNANASSSSGAPETIDGYRVVRQQGGGDFIDTDDNVNNGRATHPDEGEYDEGDVNEYSESTELINDKAYEGFRKAMGDKTKVTTKTVYEYVKLRVIKSVRSYTSTGKHNLTVNTALYVIMAGLRRIAIGNNTYNEKEWNSSKRRLLIMMKTNMIPYIKRDNISLYQLDFAYIIDQVVHQGSEYYLEFNLFFGLYLSGVRHFSIQDSTFGDIYGGGYLDGGGPPTEDGNPVVPPNANTHLNFSDNLRLFEIEWNFGSLKMVAKDVEVPKAFVGVLLGLMVRFLAIRENTVRMEP